MNEYLRVAGAIALPNACGFISGYTSQFNQTRDWYKNLKQPSYSPPGWVFGPVWTSLYSGMGYASYLVWRDGGGFRGPARLPLMFYGAQLALNCAWPQVFFRNHNLKWSFINIVALAGGAAVVGAKFYGINKTAGYLFIPYLAWLSLASTINYYLYKNNPPQHKAIGEVKSE